MRFILVSMLALPLAVHAADTGKHKPKARTAAAKKAAKPAPALVIPADATEVSPGRWRYVDKKGKLWDYFRTPMGVTRTEVAAGQAPAAESAPAGLRAIDQGDSVRFEFRAPMGLSQYTKKKTEMTEAERKVWERDTQPKPSPEQAGAATGDAPKQE